MGCMETYNDVKNNNGGVMSELKDRVRDLEIRVASLYKLRFESDLRFLLLTDELGLEYEEAVTTGPRYVKKKKESE